MKLSGNNKSFEGIWTGWSDSGEIKSGECKLVRK